MKNIIKGFVVGIITTIIFINSIAYASGNTKLIEVLFNSVNIELNTEKVANAGENYTLSNGEEVPFSIIYKGTTYLPLRKLGELLDKEVTWIGETKTVGLDDAVNDEDTVEQIQTSEEGKVQAEIKEVVTKGKLSKYIIESLDIPLVDTDLVISDVAREEELYSYIITAINENIFSLYPDNTFRANNMVTRAEYAGILINVLGLNITYAKELCKAEELELEILDIDNNWAKYYIRIAVSYGLMSKYDDNTFRPNKVYEGSLAVDNSLKSLKKELEEKVEKIIAEMECRKQELELNKPYKLESGLELVIENIKVNEEIGYYELMIDYKLENNMKDRELEEGYFTIIYDNEERDTQTGFFQTLFPYEVKKRSMKFKYLKDRNPILLEFKDFSSEDSIQFKID